MPEADERRVPAARQENESLSATVRGLEALHRSALIFLCECENPFCTEFVKLTMSEYDDARRSDGAILHPDHCESPPTHRERAA